MNSSSNRQPGLAMSGIVSRVFPLRADPSTLKAFIDSYINRPELQGKHYFRAQHSYVLMGVLNYKKMYDPLTRLGHGYFQQNELAFSIPLQWYQRNSAGSTLINGQRYSLKMHEATATAPFIFVDNDQSMLGGRELFGWPKQYMHVEQSTHLEQRPDAAESYFTAKASLFSELFRHRRRGLTDLLTITRRTRSASALTPSYILSGRPGWREPLGARDLVQHKLTHDSLYAKELQSAVADMPLSHAQRWLASATMEQAAFEKAQTRPLFGMVTNNIGLKQLPDTQSKVKAEFQSLGSSQTEIVGLRALSTLATRGAEFDIAGGYEVHIQDYEELPIVRELGLVCDSQTNDVHTLRPVMPYWVDMDLAYRLDTAYPLYTTVRGEYVEPGCTLPNFTTEYQYAEGGIWR